eukprot:3920489-Rhodomonas_salina.1
MGSMCFLVFDFRTCADRALESPFSTSNSRRVASTVRLEPGRMIHNLSAGQGVAGPQDHSSQTLCQYRIRPSSYLYPAFGTQSPSTELPPADIVLLGHRYSSPDEQYFPPGTNALRVSTVYLTVSGIASYSARRQLAERTRADRAFGARCSVVSRDARALGHVARASERGRVGRTCVLHVEIAPFAGKYQPGAPQYRTENPAQPSGVDKYRTSLANARVLVKSGQQLHIDRTGGREAPGIAHTRRGRLSGDCAVGTRKPRFGVDSTVIVLSSASLLCCREDQTATEWFCGPDTLDVKAQTLVKGGRIKTW